MKKSNGVNHATGSNQPSPSLLNSEWSGNFSLPLQNANGLFSFIWLDGRRYCIRSLSIAYPADTEGRKAKDNPHLLMELQDSSDIGQARKVLGQTDVRVGLTIKPIPGSLQKRLGKGILVTG